MTVNTRPHALIIGASVAGLGAALALAPRGYRITCVERDHTPLPQDHLDAARTWQRRGASQTRHSHVLLAPLVNLIDRYAPDLLQRLIAAGAEELGFEAVAAAAFDVVDLEPGDEEIRFLACRRVVFEYLLRRYVVEQRGVEILQGITVTGLMVSDGEPRTVNGVSIERHDGTSDTIAADIVIDASAAMAA